MEVRLRTDIRESVEPAEAAAVPILGELLGEHGLNLPLELVRGRQDGLRVGPPGARGGPAWTGGTHCRSKEAAARVLPSGNETDLAGHLGRDADRDWPAHVQRDEPAELVGHVRAPEGGVAGAAERLAGRRELAVGVDLGQALGAVLSHPIHIGSSAVVPEWSLDG